MSNFFLLVIGGAASGKSAYAENAIKNTGKPLTYIATAQIWDDEMREKISAHAERRGAAWDLCEAPFDLAAALRALPADRAVLVDCATLWLTNHMLAEHDLAAEEDALIDALVTCPAQVCVVSNEVGQGIVPDNALARRFREAQGRLNIRLAQAAETVVQVTVGLPRVLKGAPCDG
ncbi:bifunctional adenosylcobinamide kinase/adenosylcobinamide-phosphate guanylyltransferase [Pseudooceanicola nanhaiensis]|uniref:bifunctional adenosylcobinamide kinase/adenosylcobinamide-phosphate guanylyltransferase n=1 Tax=Pseudooceanicola nanhaiensis TaxID=375761 RepID=UPI001CD7B4CC|nr:bifunctional adenosylcobinamide kinase/adenosylcobinamide-phosphate guanylyltransferase [Pseudooceanicola nanhaiensis]MCA0919434.1 bifunctional adenosylcobinamide kinase/adenosylcobinamide-phosphate guanylyltransferase [Pseudooceanicola nanhaiensis]